MTDLSPASRIRGCLLGGAVGDALGAPIEFDSLERIRSEHGDDGVTGFAPAYGRTGGAITDDTQMTLWTADGLLRARAAGTDPVASLYRSYLAWLYTQGDRGDLEEPNGWLIRWPMLNNPRAPGNTCLSALRSGRMGTPDQRLNDSKGCGGVMRVAPIGLVSGDPFELGVAAAAITHTHPSGYLAAGAFAHIIAGLYAGQGLAESIEESLGVLETWSDHEETSDAIRAAVDLAGEGLPTPEQVERLGAGWVAEEALAISLYCAITAPNFRSGVLTAVNHSGDSDSTGAITGNLLGTMQGEDAIPSKWLYELEGRSMIMGVADDLTAAFVEGQPVDTGRYPPWRSRCSTSPTSCGVPASDTGSTGSTSRCSTTMACRSTSGG